MTGKGEFKERRDATGKHGIHPLIKLIAALRVLAYGMSYEQVDELCELSESSTLNVFYSFLDECIAVKNVGTCGDQLKPILVLFCRSSVGTSNEGDVRAHIPHIGVASRCTSIPFAAGVSKRVERYDQVQVSRDYFFTPFEFQTDQDSPISNSIGWY